MPSGTAGSAGTTWAGCWMSWAGYIIQDGEAGVAVYRLAHQSLADHIRPPFVPSYRQVFDPQALPVAAALLDRYALLLANGVPVTGPGYLWRYAWPPVAAAGGRAGADSRSGSW